MFYVVRITALTEALIITGKIVSQLLTAQILGSLETVVTDTDGAMVDLRSVRE